MSRNSPWIKGECLLCKKVKSLRRHEKMCHKCSKSVKVFETPEAKKRLGGWIILLIVFLTLLAILGWVF